MSRALDPAGHSSGTRGSFPSRHRPAASGVSEVRRSESAAVAEDHVQRLRENPWHRVLRSQPEVERENQDRDDDADDKKEDLPEALWILAGDPPRDAVRDHLKHFRAVGVRQHPDGHEDVLERPSRVRGMDHEIAVRVGDGFAYA